jgi:hypothetical protein
LADQVGRHSGLREIVSWCDERDGEREREKIEKRLNAEDLEIHGEDGGLFVGGGFGVGNFFAGERVQLVADDVGGESGAEEAAVEGGDFVFGDFAAREAEFTFDALANESDFVVLLGVFFEGGFDVAVGNAAGAEVAGDAEAALAADFRALASELFGVASVVDQAFAFEAVDCGCDELVIVSTVGEGLLHFVDGMRAAHEDAGGGGIEVGFRCELAGTGKHREKMKEGSKEVKREGEELKRRVMSLSYK